MKRIAWFGISGLLFCWSCYGSPIVDLLSAEKAQETYEKEVAWREQFNEMQRSLGLPLLPIPSLEEWQQTLEQAKALLEKLPGTPRPLREELLEKRWEESRADLCVAWDPDDYSNSPPARAYRELQERLRELAEEARRRQPEIERQLDAIANKHHIERREVNRDGVVRVLVGEINGYPVWIQNYGRTENAAGPTPASLVEKMNNVWLPGEATSPEESNLSGSFNQQVIGVIPEPSAVSLLGLGGGLLWLLRRRKR